MDVPRMQVRKEKVVAQNNDGILFLFKKNKIAFFHGRGAFAGGGAEAGWTIKVDGAASRKPGAEITIKGYPSRKPSKSVLAACATEVTMPDGLTVHFVVGI